MKKLSIIIAIAALLATTASLGNQFDAQARISWKKTLKTVYRESKKSQKQNNKNNNNINIPAASTSVSTTSLNYVRMPRGTANAPLAYKSITVYFNPSLRIPNCVAYRLTATQVSMTDAPGAEKRKNYKFYADSHVKGCPEWYEYKNSGYSRGHMAPAMDMRHDKTSMAQCFLMTNICPQDASLNQGPWNEMEQSIHRLARKLGEIYIITGPIMGNGTPRRIGPNHDIAVPQALFKILYAPRQQKGIAFIFDNTPCKGSFKNHAVTIDEVERRTGMDFFSVLPDKTEAAIERQCTINSWF